MEDGVQTVQAYWEVLSQVPLTGGRSGLSDHSLHLSTSDRQVTRSSTTDLSNHWYPAVIRMVLMGIAMPVHHFIAMIERSPLGSTVMLASVTPV